MTNENTKLDAIKNRIIEVIENSKCPTRLMINISGTIDEIPTISYEIDELIIPFDNKSSV